MHCTEFIQLVLPLLQSSSNSSSWKFSESLHSQVQLALNSLVNLSAARQFKFLNQTKSKQNPTKPNQTSLNLFAVYLDW